MNYKINITSQEDANFLCEIAIRGDQNFQDLHNKIVEALNYDGSQMASFFLLDEGKNRAQEISLIDLSGEDNSGTLLMESTTIEEVVANKITELEYIFDFFADRFFSLTIEGEYPLPLREYPYCIKQVGAIPEQMEFSLEEDWSMDGNNSSDDYDDSFMDEFGEDSFSSKGDYGDDEYDKYENLDDYIDRI